MHIIFSPSIVFGAKARKMPHPQDTVSVYLHEIRNLHPLNTADENNLAEQAASGNTETRDRLIRANLNRVVLIARGFTDKGLPLEDLIGEGNDGLMTAIGQYKRSRGNFSALANYRIKQSIQRAIIKQAATIRLPEYLEELIVKWYDASDCLEERLGRLPSFDEVRAQVNLRPRKVALIEKAFALQTALNPAGSNMRTARLLNKVASDKPSHEELYDCRDFLEFVNRLDTREATVIRMMFGLNDEQPKKLKDIGQTIGLSRERARQISVEAMDKLHMEATGEKPEVITPEKKRVKPKPKNARKKSRVVMRINTLKPPLERAIIILKTIRDRDLANIARLSIGLDKNYKGQKPKTFNDIAATVKQWPAEYGEGKKGRSLYARALIRWAQDELCEKAYGVNRLSKDEAKALFRKYVLPASIKGNEKKNPS